jgi:hypothetical protein
MTEEILRCWVCKRTEEEAQCKIIERMKWNVKGPT